MPNLIFQGLKTKLGLKFEVWDPNGNLIEERYEPGHSWVRNAYNAYAMQVFQMSYRYSEGFSDGFLNIKTDIAGLQFCMYSSAWVHSYYLSTDSIRVGTSNATFHRDHYNLQARIAHGTGSGQLTHQNSQDSGTGLTYDAGTETYNNAFERYFNNNSGGSITVRETGLFIVNSGSSYMMMARDVLGTAITVADAGQLKVTYAISIKNPLDIT